MSIYGHAVLTVAGINCYRSVLQLVIFPKQCIVCKETSLNSIFKYVSKWANIHIIGNLI